jgi:hypothetical protein
MGIQAVKINNNIVIKNNLSFIAIFLICLVTEIYLNSENQPKLPVLKPVLLLLLSYLMLRSEIYYGCERYYHRLHTSPTSVHQIKA